MQQENDAELVFDHISRASGLDRRILSIVHPKLKVYAGPMYSGKSRELIGDIGSITDRISLMDESMGGPIDADVNEFVIAFTPTSNTRDIDQGNYVIKTRGSGNNPVTHPAVALPATEPWQMLSRKYHRFPFVVIDEANFYGRENIETGTFNPTGLMRTVQILVEQGREVYAAGLDTNYRADPFGEMGSLLAIAQERVFLKPLEPKGESLEGMRTQRFTGGKPSHYSEQLIRPQSAKDEYAPREITEHIVPGRREAIEADIRGYVEKERS